MITYNYTDPKTDAVSETTYLVPGLAWDTILNCSVWVLHFDPFDRAFLMLDNQKTPRRSRQHIRAATQREKDAVSNPSSESPSRVLNQRNAEPYDRDSFGYKQFLKYLGKANRLASVCRRMTNHRADNIILVCADVCYTTVQTILF